MGLKTPEPTIPTARYADLGGVEDVIREIEQIFERPFRYPHIYTHLGVDAPRGVLLHGPPGCGKTFLATAIAGELGIPLIQVAATELVSGMSGESEGRIRELFDQARQTAPALLFLDEIDAITPKRETAQREMERRIVAQLLACMDELSQGKAQVMVIGATNRPDSLDPALRRAGRFDREIRMGVPDERARERILRVVCGRLRLGGGIDLALIARNTPGFVGADLKALAQEAANAAIERIFAEQRRKDVEMVEASTSSQYMDISQAPQPAQLMNESTTTTTTAISDFDGNLDSLAIEMQDMLVALEKVQPSAKREGFAVVPDTTWDQVGSLGHVIDELRMAVVQPIKHPEMFAAVGINAPAGVLLWGPPGCGKTLLAKAVANESHSNFISVKGPELLNKYVGESERAVRQVFERARASAPCVIFFDELDALCPRRGDDTDSATSRVVNQLLAEMDGLEGRRQVFILAATNRPDIIDPAMTRPGRLDKLLYVYVPPAADRAQILKALSPRTPWDPATIDLHRIAHDQRCEGFTGADLFALVREASLAAIRERLLVDHGGGGGADQIKVSMRHVDIAFGKVKRSVSLADLQRYEDLRGRWEVTS